MSKKIVMYILMSVVATIVSTVGSFMFKDKSQEDRQMLVVQHPDGCYLLEPRSIADGMSTVVDAVNVKPGKNTFKFDCNGKQIEVVKDVKPGETMWNFEPDK